MENPMPIPVHRALSKYGGVYLVILKNVIYLTFDEGYENGYTSKYLMC